MRCAVSGFFHFAEYLLQVLPDEIPGFHFVAMLFGNQSPLERQFSAFRSSGDDRGDNFADAVTTKNSKQANAAQQNSNAYMKEDCPEETDKEVNGTAQFTKYQRQSSEKLSAWIQKREKCVSEMNGEEPLFASNKLSILAEKTNTHAIQHHFIDKLLNGNTFQ